MFQTKTFTFILNPITTVVELPYEVIPGHRLRRATEEERERIRKFLYVGGFSSFKEFAYVEINPDAAHPEILPDQWKFFGIESQTNAEIQSLQLAGNLLEKDIALGPSFGRITGPDNRDAQTILGSPYKLAQFSGDPFSPGPDIPITAEDISTWRGINLQIAALSRDALRPFRAFDNLREVSQESPLFALGLFAVLESLITHDPHDQFDSLSHQVSTKMVLLSKRFERALPYAQFGCAEIKLWKKLYEYRSCVAHGSPPRFDSGSLSLLGNAERAHKFLGEALKLLLLQVLTEPQLITDLKEC